MRKIHGTFGEVKIFSIPASTGLLLPCQADFVLQPQLPVTSYGLTLLTKRLLYRNTPDFALRAPLMLTLTIFQFPYHFRRALSPYMIQEMLMADGSTSEVLQTHVQCKRHSRLTSSTSTVLSAQEQCLRSSCTLYHTWCHIHHSSI
jgi:hypothetical protein